MFQHAVYLLRRRAFTRTSTQRVSTSSSDRASDSGACTSTQRRYVRQKLVLHAAPQLDQQKLEEGADLCTACSETVAWLSALIPIQIHEYSSEICTFHPALARFDKLVLPVLSHRSISIDLSDLSMCTKQCASICSESECL